MSEEIPISTRPESAGNANLIYILYLIGIAIGLTALVGVIMAYLGRGRGSAMLDSHYTHQIHIFWKALLYSILGVVLSPVLIGYLILVATVIWYVVRCVKGMQALAASQPVEDPTRWSF